MNTPLSESSVSHKLEEIQKRCNRLMEKPNGLLELTLEEALVRAETDDPYNRRKS